MRWWQSLIRAVALVGGIAAIAHWVTEPGINWGWVVAGGVCLGIYNAANDVWGKR